MSTLILQVALDTPLRRMFDYRPPVPAGAAAAAALPRPGARVEVPFGRRRLIGILVAVAATSDVPAARLRHATAILDAEPVFDPVTFGLLLWAADYYHHPVGEVFAAALPASLRAGQGTRAQLEYWSLTPRGHAELQSPCDRRGPQLRALLAWLGAAERTPGESLPAAFRPAQLRTLAARGWIEALPLAGSAAPAVPTRTDLVLSDAQAEVVAQINASLGRFAAHLLYGVTGSGKTEVYLRSIAARGRARRPGARAGARDRADAAAGRALRAALRRRDCGAALGACRPDKRAMPGAPLTAARRRS